MLRYDDRIVALFAHRVAPTPETVATGGTLLDMLEWRGVATIEYRSDPTTGRDVFIGLSSQPGRLVERAMDAGVDFPALLVGCALGGQTVPVTPTASWCAA